MTDVNKHPVLFTVVGITCGVIACMFLFIPLFCKLVTPFIIPSNITINPDGTLNKELPLIDRNSILIALAYGMSGLAMSFIVILFAKNKRMRNVFYASIIVLFSLISNLCCFNSSDPNYTFSDSLARNITVKQIQAEGILSSILLFVFAIFGAWVFSKISKEVR
jgi:hypothetical protein